VREDYGENYRELYERHWWWRSREKVILDVLRAIKPPEGWERILDVGCGAGLFFDQLSRFGTVEGIEPAEALVNNGGVRCSSIHVVPFDEKFQPGRRYSLILMLDVLEHLADPPGALRHALTLLEPAGALLITVPAFRLLWTNHDILNDHYTRYTKRSLGNVARQAGLRIESERYFFQWVFPVKLVCGVVERGLGLQPKPPRLPTHWINRGLYYLSRLEQKTWGKLLMPFGSSLMVLARKPPLSSKQDKNS
jgi:SAM-dependent methyltransferase